MRVKGNGALRFIEKSGLAHVRSRQKFVPAGVFALPRESIAAFLGALWDCDGHVSRDVALATLSTTSWQLAREVQSLLLRLGVWSTVREHAQPSGSYGTGVIWGVEVAGADRVGSLARSPSRTSRSRVGSALGPRYPRLAPGRT